MKIEVIWSSEARADLRAIDRIPAIQILHCVDDYRIFFGHESENAIRITGVRNRKQAYR